MINAKLPQKIKNLVDIKMTITKKGCKKMTPLLSEGAGTKTINSSTGVFVCCGCFKKRTTKKSIDYNKLGRNKLYRLQNYF